MTVYEYLEDLKSRPASADLFREHERQEVMMALNVWKAMGIEFRPPEGDLPPGEIEKQQAVWEACLFQPDMWVKLLGFIPRSGLLSRLAKANLIYPDGTINEPFLEVLKWLDNVKDEGGENGRQERRRTRSRRAGGSEEEGE